MTDSPIFIVGAPRSGTSLLRNLLRSHPHLAFGNESHFVPSFYRAYGDPSTRGAARRLAARILRLRWIRMWGVELEPSSLDHHRSYAELVAAIYEEMARRTGKRRWGDKTPHYVREMPTLRELFPGAKFLHIYRDGRDVAVSWSQVPFGPGNLYTQASAWRTLVETGRRDGRALPAGTYLEVRYEDLLTSPEETMRRVCAFLGEPFTEEVLRPTPLPRSARWSGRPPRPGRPLTSGRIEASNLGKWRSAMSGADRALFETIAGDLLADLGYPTEGLRRHVASHEALAWKVEDRIRRTKERLTRRPVAPLTLALQTEAGLRERLRRASPRTGRMRPRAASR